MKLVAEKHQMRCVLFCFTAGWAAGLPEQHHGGAAGAAGPGRGVCAAQEKTLVLIALQGGRPVYQSGTTAERPVLPVPGEVFALRKLLPQNATYDFNVHVMDFLPGEFLNVKVRPPASCVLVSGHLIWLADPAGEVRHATYWRNGASCMATIWCSTPLVLDDSGAAVRCRIATS